jgi:hypothetical protein
MRHQDLHIIHDNRSSPDRTCHGSKHKIQGADSTTSSADGRITSNVNIKQPWHPCSNALVKIANDNAGCYATTIDNCKATLPHYTTESDQLLLNQPLIICRSKGLALPLNDMSKGKGFLLREFRRRIKPRMHLLWSVT